MATPKQMFACNYPFETKAKAAQPKASGTMLDRN